jgi:hypothetical protein
MTVPMEASSSASAVGAEAISRAATAERGIEGFSKKKKVEREGRKGRKRSWTRCRWQKFGIEKFQWNGYLSRTK